jgi:hypothetical protein
MPALAVSLNGEQLSVVSTDGLNLLSVRVHGDCIGPEFAVIEFSGGYYGEDKEKSHLIWEDSRGIRPDDEIQVTLLESASTSRPGKTIEDLYSDEEEVVGPFQTIEDHIRSLALKPKARERFTFKVIPPNATAIVATTRLEDHSFGFSVSWAWVHPERAKVSLSSSSLEEIASRRNGAHHTDFVLQYGESVRLRVGMGQMGSV